MSSFRRVLHMTGAVAAALCLSAPSQAVPQNAAPAASHAAPTPATPTPAQATAQAPAVSPPATEHSALLQSADALVREVAALRGLPPKTTIARGVLSREQIVDKQRARIAKQLTPEDIRHEAGVLKRLGLLPSDMNYEKTVFDLFADQVAGFYDPPTRTLYIADWLPVPLQRPALAHEIQHALQDQYFDLQKFVGPIKEEGDASLARSAVVEGDGIAVMLELPAKGSRPDVARSPMVLARLGKQMMYLTMGATPSFQKAPAALRETMIFPYASGLEFVGTYRGDGGWARVNDLFRDPPESTEQVMHPDKYIAREHPVRIASAPLSTLVGSGRKEVRRDVMGELMWKIWFSSAMAQSQAETAAEGWGGDRLVAYAGPSDDQPLVLALTAWDSDLDADEAELASRRVLADLVTPPPPSKDAARKDAPKPTPITAAKDSKPPSPSAVNKPARSGPFWTYKGDAAYGLVRRDRQIALFLGIPKGSEAAISEEIFRAFRVTWPSPAGTPPELLAPASATTPSGASAPPSRPPGPWR